MQKYGNSLKNAIRISKESMKRDGIGKYYLFFVLNFLFSISIFMSPFNVSKWEMANEMKKGNKVSITNIYDNASGKRYFNQLQANVLKIAMFVAIALILCTVGAILYFIGTSIYYFSGSKDTSIYWAIPAMVLIAAFLFIIPYIQVPNAYITNTYPSLSPSSVLRFSFYAYKNGGKLRMLAINALEYGIKLLVLLPFVIAAIVCYNNVRSSANVGFLMLFLSLGVALYIAIYPFVTLPAIMMKKELFDEIVFVKNSNKFEATFDFEVDRTDTEKTLNNIFGIETKKKEKFSSIEDKHKKLEEIDKKSKKKEKLKKEFEESEEEVSEPVVEDEPQVTEEVQVEEAREPQVEEVTEVETNDTIEEVVEEEVVEEEVESNEVSETLDTEPEEVIEETTEEVIEEETTLDSEPETEEVTEETEFEEVQEDSGYFNQDTEEVQEVEETEPEVEEIIEVDETEPQVEEIVEEPKEEPAVNSNTEDDEFSNYISGLKEDNKKSSKKTKKSKNKEE